MPFALQQQHRETNKCIDAGGALHAACREAGCTALHNSTVDLEMS